MNSRRLFRFAMMTLFLGGWMGLRAATDEEVLAQPIGFPSSPTGLELAEPTRVALRITIRPHAVKQGLTEEVVRARLLPPLAEAGIVDPAPDGQVFLEVEVDSDSTGTFYSLGMHLHRPVLLTRGGQTYSASGVTWHRSIQGTFNQEAELVLVVLDRFAGEFARDHKLANPLATLRGKITASDPKFQFVVVDIGAEDGVKAGMEMAVKREGQTVAFIRVTKVQTDHAIANVLQSPQPGSVLENDDVFPRP